jgi:hypothetical protein
VITVSNYILGLLNEDMVSHGLLVQCVEEYTRGDGGLLRDWKDVLGQLLLSGNVEIGDTQRTSLGYVEFIAWRGTVGERIARAIECADSATGPNHEFAYWICLQENVDRFEGEGHKESGLLSLD